MKKEPRLSYSLLSIFFSVLFLWNCQQKLVDDSKTKGPQFNENIRPTDPRTPEEERLGFILPPGFEIQLFASEPNIDKPMNMTFDAKGRMWVSQSFEYPFPSEPGIKSTDRLTIVEDTDGDGKADKFTDVADTLNIPIGVLPVEKGAISFSVPYVYKFNDGNEDGKPESSKVMFGPFGYQDTHGMVSNFIRGYDGWVHACHGFTNKSSFAGVDGDTITLISGNTFRFKLDGTRVEQVTFGQVNPFGLVYDAFGYIYSTDSHSSPLYQLINGGDYPHFGKVSIMGFGPDMKSLQDEATALCGITQYADTQFPKDFHNNFFIGDVVNSRVHRYSSTWKGSSPVGKSEDDFIKSEDPWFRPVNIKLGPDGALYVADFYNAIIGHYEVPLNHPKRDKQRGRIWRITYKGKANEKMDLSKSTIDQLIVALDANNLTVRMLATDQITDRVGDEATNALKQTIANQKTSATKYIHAMWALHRLNSLTDDDLKNSITHSDSLIRIHTLRILAERVPQEQFYDLTLQALNDKSPHVQRTALELLAKYPSVKSVESTLAVLQKTKSEFDNHLFYTARLGLRNLLRHENVLNEVVTKTWSEQDAGFMAGVMVDVPLAASAKFLIDYMAKYKLPDERIPPAYTQIARFTPDAQLKTVVEKALADNGNSINLRLMIFKGLQDGLNQRGGKVDTKIFFSKWAPALATEIFKKYPGSDLTDSEEKVVQQRIAIDVAGDYKVKSLEPQLKLFLDQGSKIGMTIRSAALRSLMKIDIQSNASIGGWILQSDSMIEYQKRIANVMAEFPGKEVNNALDGVKNINPNLQEFVFLALAGSPQGKDILFAKIKRGELLPRMLQQPRVEERVLMKATPAQLKEFNSLIADLEPISKEKQELIDKRVTAFDGLDKDKLSLDSGKIVFQQNCGVCHKLGGQLSVGPQLDGIAKTGAHGLIEKILDPNRNISKAFKNYTIQLKDGTVKSGLFRREDGATKIFVDLTGKEFSIAKKDIAEQKESKYTLMPDSFGSSIPDKEFNQLINYLLTL